MQKHWKTIEFDRILSLLADFALSESAKEKALALSPLLKEAECKARMAETTGARIIIDGMGTPPVSPMTDIAQTLQLVSLGSLLTPEQLSAVAVFITTCRRMQSYLKKAEAMERMVAYYGQSLIDLSLLHDEIERCIRVDRVDDHASGELRDIRHRMDAVRDAVKGKLESMLRSHKEWFSEGFIVTRGERFALPVKKQYRHQVSGAVLDTSSTGQTVFIEPTQARKLTDELADLQIAEENEVRRILYMLTAEVEDHLQELRQNVRTMETLDFLFAKAKLSAAMEAIEPEITTERRIVIHGGRHPLLDPAKCVPLEFTIGENGITGVIITGPNTGGKTVSLKTVGLLSLMAQSGLHVPAQAGSVFSMHANVLCDIGDGQSITENLSTFSAHMTNIVGILAETTHESLVLLDELGSGTDPAEGMGLAVAILEELRMIGCLLVATSHYPEIKEYAARTAGLTNARMAFDRETLSPLYQLQMGEAGESCALYIAQRLGFSQHILSRAREAAYAAGKQNTSSALPSWESEPAGKRKKAPSRIQKHEKRPDTPRHCDQFRRGDSVRIFPQKEIGIVYQTADDMGNLGVQVKGKKMRVNHRNIKLLVSATELYPDDYDFSIVFDTVANRKARNKLDRGNPEGVIEYEEGISESFK